MTHTATVQHQDSGPDTNQNSAVRKQQARRQQTRILRIHFSDTSVPVLSDLHNQKEQNGSYEEKKAEEGKDFGAGLKTPDLKSEASAVLPAYDPWQDVGCESAAMELDKLLAFGFQPDGLGYSATFGLEGMEDELAAKIIILPDSPETSGEDSAFHISVQILDLAFQEEYRPFYLSKATGTYVESAREAWRKLLKRMLEHCAGLSYESRQTKVLQAYAATTWHDRPDFPFSGYDYFVLRHPHNNKWYALFMEVPKKVLRKELQSQRLQNQADHNQKISAVQNEENESDVKSFYDLLPEKLSTVTLKTTPDCSPDESIFMLPGYHMNHKSWTTVILDQGIRDEQVLQALKASRNAVWKPSIWIVPANPRYFDIFQLFTPEHGGLWKQTAKISPGDLVYLYAGLPMGYIVYKTRVTRADIPYEYQDDNLKIKQAMELSLIEEYSPDQYSRAWLEEHGVKSIRSARRLPQDVAELLEESEEKN